MVAWVHADEDELIIPQTVETGDSVKMKQVMDDAVIKAVSHTAYDVPSRSSLLLLLLLFSCYSVVVDPFCFCCWLPNRPSTSITCSA